MMMKSRTSHQGKGASLVDPSHAPSCCWLPLLQVQFKTVARWLLCSCFCSQVVVVVVVVVMWICSRGSRCRVVVGWHLCGRVWARIGMASASCGRCFCLVYLEKTLKDYIYDAPYTLHQQLHWFTLETFSLKFKEKCISFKLRLKRNGSADVDLSEESISQRKTEECRCQEVVVGAKRQYGEFFLHVHCPRLSHIVPPNLCVTFEIWDLSAPALAHRYAIFLCSLVV